MKLSNNIYFTIQLFFGILGIYVANLLSGSFALFMYISCSLFLCIILIAGYYKRFLLLAIVSFFVFNLGAFYALTFINTTYEKQINFPQYMGEYLEYESKVLGIQKRESYEDTYLMLSKKIGEDISAPYQKHLLVLPKNFQLSKGETIRFSGTFRIFEDFNSFAYEKYMLSSGVHFSVRSANVMRIQESEENFFTSVHILRSHMLERVHTIFPREEAIFLGGILIGAREDIPEDLKEDFNNSGLTHFIAVSGFNISICIIFIAFLTKFMPRSIRVVVVVLSVLLFSLFVGFGAPVVRAAIMGILAYIFLQTGNALRSLTLLFFTVLCMSLYSPLALNYDVSMHLSFLAVLGIIYTQEYFQKIFFFVPNTLAIREALVLTLAALIFTLPIMIFQFGQVSLLAPFANIAVTWTIPLAMLLGALTLIADYFSEVLGMGVGFLTWILLAYDIAMVRFFGNIESALLQFNPGIYKNYYMMFYFIIMTYIVSYYRLKK